MGKLLSEKKVFVRETGILLVLVLISTLLSINGKVFNIAPNTPAFFIAIAFMVPFGIWYGWRGVLAAYLGCLCAMLITLPSIPVGWAMVFSLADMAEVAIPAVAFWYFKADPALKTIRDMGIYLVFGIVINSLAGAFIGTMTVFMAGINKYDSVLVSFGSWAGGDMVLIFLITSILLSFGTPILRRKGLLEQKEMAEGCRSGENG
jgi:integral membrane sensor domain MASE1